VYSMDGEISKRFSSMTRAARNVGVLSFGTNRRAVPGAIALVEIHPVLNNTKWEELRLAMYAIEPPPRWRCMTITGYYSEADAGWFYHFRSGGYEDIQYVDIFTDSQTNRERIRSALKAIHLPGEETDDGFRVYGYALPGHALNYL
jgi:hypothetical protein